MDKYEYNLKLEQMKELLFQEKYEEAAEVADSINWNKVKNVNALVKAGEVYEKVDRYDESREILLNAYDRSPIGRTIIYRLAEVAIKMEDYEGAQEYYDEFVSIAPHDNQRYILMYSIKKAQGASYEELIPILEEFKEQEYTEEWAFELADLYHKAGRVDQCIEACDELVLWFGDGPYVERALELKMIHKPLTKMQEDKYKKFRNEKERKTVIHAEKMEKNGEFIQESVVIPQVTINTEPFNTTNLQEEIVKGMQKLMEAAEKEEDVAAMDNIKKITDEIPYLQLSMDKEPLVGEVLIEEPVIEEPVIEELFIEEEVMEEPVIEELVIEEELIEEPVMKELVVEEVFIKETVNEPLKFNFQNILGEDTDGQMHLVMKEKAVSESQIAGQITIMDILKERALQEEEQKKLESAKAKALQEAEDIMTRLNDVLPKIDTAKTPEELFNNMNSMLDQEIARLNSENEAMDEQLRKLEREILLSTQQTVRMPVIDFEALKNVTNAVTAEEEPAFKEPDISREELFSEKESIPQADIVIEVDTEASSDFIREISLKEHLADDEIEDLEQDDFRAGLRAEAEPIYCLTEEQKAIFSYFVPVKGMESQLCKALSNIISYFYDYPYSSSKNLIIQGCQGCGKTVLATSIIKVLQAETGRLKGRIGKIDASALNQKDIKQLLKKVAGGCLIIEKAGELERTTTVTLSLLLEQETSGVFVILEDTAAGIKKALLTDDGFAKKFTEVVKVPIFTNEELIVFANSYANELGYVIDEMAVLALHNRISNIEKLDQATTLVEVKDIIDEAIEREANGGLRKALNILTAKRYTDDDKIVLTEKDFE